MKRSCYLLALMLLSSSANASDAYSFVVGGHRIRVEAPRGCRSASCLSLSIPGIYQTRRRPDGAATLVAAPEPAPAQPLAPTSEPAVSRPIAPAASQPSAPVVCAPPLAIVRPAAPARVEIAALPAPQIQPPATTPMPPSGIVAVPPVVDAAPQASRAPDDGGEAASVESPLGLWQSRGGSVRIERCGAALCGYVFNPASKANGEAVLINMKPKAAREWSGNIYSRDSGNTYYATVEMQGPNSLRVEACALGRLLCSGNVWSRIGAKPEKWMTSRPSSPAPS